MSALVIGLTGGIGSGKSTVGRLFTARGIVVVDADQCSRAVVEPGTQALAMIAAHFGSKILQADGSLDRAKLRAVIFENPEEKAWLEQLLHPLIHGEIRRRLANADSPYAILESPLLVETGQNSLSQHVLVVDVDEEQQVQRAMQRDNNSEVLVRAIMGAQASRDERRRYADDIISNTGDLAALEQQVDALHAKYLALATTTH